MIQVNIFEQIKTVFQIFTSNKNILLISLIAGFTLLILTVINYIKAYKMKKVILISIYLLIFGIFLYFYSNEIFSFIDYLINNIFILFLFPNLAFYTLIIIVINILVMKTLLNIRSSKIIKNINTIFFVIFNIIFYLIIDNVIKNNIVVYETLDIYTNRELLTLIQISIYLFIIYLLIMLISKISNKFIRTINIKEPIAVKENSRRFLKSKKISLKSATTPNTIVINNVNKNINHEQNKIPDLKEINNKNIISNTLRVNNQEINNLKTINFYNEYIEIEPIKKNKVELKNIDNIFRNNSNITRVQNNNSFSGILRDVEKLKENKNDAIQLQKIYKLISLNSKDLTLKDYNILINILKEIKNS